MNHNFKPGKLYSVIRKFNIFGIAFEEGDLLVFLVEEGKGNLVGSDLIFLSPKCGRVKFYSSTRNLRHFFMCFREISDDEV